MDDILGALEIEWMKREAEHLDKKTREMLRPPENLCETCLFCSFCKTIRLPHCNGEDYVKERRDDTRK
jgi:hypothetical protein